MHLQQDQPRCETGSALLGNDPFNYRTSEFDVVELRQSARVAVACQARLPASVPLGANIRGEISGDFRESLPYLVQRWLGLVYRVHLRQIFVIQPLGRRIWRHIGNRDVYLLVLLQRQRFGWPQDAMDWAASRGQRPDAQRPDARPQRYFLAGSLVVFLAGLGTAAFIAGGEPQAQSPAPAVTPQVGVYTMEHDDMNGLFMNPPVQPAPAVPGGESRPGLRP